MPGAGGAGSFEPDAGADAGVLFEGLRERFVPARGGGRGHDGGPGWLASPMRTPFFQSWLRSLDACGGAKATCGLLLTGLSAVFFARKVRALLGQSGVEVCAEH